jgi:pimeloyl-ACP methyl ester carboxylesterase
VAVRRSVLSFFMAWLPITVSAVSAEAQSMPRAAGMIEVDDVRLYHEVWGAGPPVVLIAGLSASLWLWEKQLPELSRHFRTIAFDNRGAGRSGAPQGPYTIGRMADDVAGLLDALGVERAHVLGFSMGGFVAQEFALRYPERVDRLVLAATSAGGPTHVAAAPEVMAAFLPTAEPPREWIRNRLHLAYTAEYLRDPGRVERMIDLRLEHPQPPHGYRGQLAGAAVFDRSGEVSRIRAPTLILAAEGDPLVPVGNASYLAAQIPGSRLIVYEGLAHQFNVEAHERFNRDIVDFLRGPRQPGH